MRDLGTFGGSSSFALAVNAVGQVAGYAYGPDDAWYHAFLYDARSGAPIQDLGSLGVSSLATDINDAGQVTGYSRDANGELCAFRYADGRMREVLPAGAQGSEAHAINAAGAIVGYAYYADGRRVAFLDDGTNLRELGTLGGSRFSDAVAINGSGLAVGSSINPAANAEHAAAWGPGYGLVDLNERVKDLPQDVVLVAALAVADDGAIVVRTNVGLGLLRPRK
jgi:probable HAF family extracellular repeat protein